MEITEANATETVRSKDPVVVGRSRSADVRIGDDHVSGKHVRVTLGADSAVVEDLDSTNGTYVNGDRIDGAITVTPGDRIEIGQSVMRLRWVDGDAS